jgi:hypothetical protein
MFEKVQNMEMLRWLAGRQGSLSYDSARANAQRLELALRYLTILPLSLSVGVLYTKSSQNDNLYALDCGIVSRLSRSNCPGANTGHLLLVCSLARVVQKSISTALHQQPLND